MYDVACAVCSCLPLDLREYLVSCCMGVRTGGLRAQKHVCPRELPYCSGFGAAALKTTADVTTVLHDDTASATPPAQPSLQQLDGRGFDGSFSLENCRNYVRCSSPSQVFFCFCDFRQPTLNDDLTILSTAILLDLVSGT